MNNIDSNIKIANTIIADEVVKVLRDQFVGADIGDMEAKDSTITSIISLTRQILQKHADDGEINLAGIGIFAAPTGHGHISIWADTMPEKQENVN